MLVLFYPINLIVVYSLNENNPQLLAYFKSVAKQLLIFFCLFLSPSPWQFSSLKKHVISLNYDPPILEYFWKNATHPPVNYYPMVLHLYKLYISEGNIIKAKAKERPNFWMKNEFSDPLETFQLMETFVLEKILNPIYQVVVSDSTKFEDFAVLFFKLVVSGHKRHV